MESHKDILNELIGFSPFNMNVINSGESTLGNLIVDAFRKIGNADISLINSATIRNNLNEGNITYKEIFDIMPFSNSLEIKNITGQTILDALEYGISDYPNGAPKFPQVSGLTFKFNKNIKSTVVIDSSGNFVEVKGQRRVFEVMIGNKKLIKENYYTICTHDFISKGGDGYSMFIDYDKIESGLGLEYEALVDYIKKDLNGIIPYNYQKTEGRIIITTEGGDEQNLGQNLKLSKFIMIMMMLMILL